VVMMLIFKLDFGFWHGLILRLIDVQNSGKVMCPWNNVTKVAMTIVISLTLARLGVSNTVNYRSLTPSGDDSKLLSDCTQYNRIVNF
jgi:hypothetical protein